MYSVVSQSLKTKLASTQFQSQHTQLPVHNTNHLTQQRRYDKMEEMSKQLSTKKYTNPIMF